MSKEKDTTHFTEEGYSRSLIQTQEISTKIETEFLALIINNSEDIPKIMGIVKEEDFLTEQARCLFKVMVSCFKKYNGPFSVMHLMGEISMMNYTGIIPYDYISSIQLAAPLDKKITAKSMGQLMFEVSMLRRILGFSKWTYDICQSNETKDMQQLISDIKTELDRITDIPQFQTESLRTVVSEIRQSINDETGTSNFESVTTNNEYLDSFFRFCAKEYIVLAARQKSGKTKLLILIITLILRHNKNVSVFWISIEDDKQKLIRNMVATMTGLRVDDIERNKLSFDQRKVVNECLNIIDSWDLEIHYEKPTVEVAAMKYSRFQKNRKGKFCIFIYDNFNGAVDVERSGSSTTEKSERVAGNFQTILTNGNSEGYKTMMVILDHLKKDYNKDEAERVGYRPNQSDLISSERKLSVLTQLVMINKPGLFKTFVDSEAKKSPLFFKDRTLSRADILSKLMILDMTLNRNGGTDATDDMPILRITADLGLMKFRFWAKDERCSITKSDVMIDRGIDTPEKITFEMIRDDLHSINPIGDIEHLFREVVMIVGNERKDKLGIVTLDFLITRYREYVSYYSTLQNEKFTKKENTIEKPTEWIFKGLYNNRYIKPTTGDDAARDSYLYNIM